MVILQSSKVLIYAWTVHVKWCELVISLHLFLREFDITYWLKTLPQKWIEAFALWYKNNPTYISLIAACAAAKRAIGTRNGEQDT